LIHAYRESKIKRYISIIAVGSVPGRGPGFRHLKPRAIAVRDPPVLGAEMAREPPTSCHVDRGHFFDGGAGWEEW